MAARAKPAGFTHFLYVNPDAPKGGRVTFAKQGSYDSLNPLIVKGEPAEGVRDYVYESLLARANDEPFTLYGLIAESGRDAARPELRRVHAEPSGEVLRRRPDHRGRRDLLARAAARSRAAQSPLLLQEGRQGGADRRAQSALHLRSKRRPRDAADHGPDAGPAETSHRPRHSSRRRRSIPPIGSGPYTIAKVDPGKSITFKRDPDYWGRDLPVNRGLYNFDEIRYDYYRDAGSMFEAFKSGLVQLRDEDDPTRWTEGYDFPALRDGRVVKEELPLETAGRNVGARLQHAAPAVRRPARARGADQAVRFRMGQPHALSRPIRAHAKAISRARICPRMAIPADATERALLAPYLDQVKPAIMDGSFALPVSDGSGENREGRHRGAQAAGAGRLPVEGRQARQCGDRRAVSIRDSRRHPRPGTAPAHLCRAP